MRRAISLCLIVAAATVGSAQSIVREMTPAAVAEAKARPKGGVPAGMLLAAGRRPIGFFSTPFMRVQLAAMVARREYRELSDDLLTAEVLAPELHIVANAVTDGPNTATVKTVVITPRKGTPEQKAASAIRPLRFEPIPTTFKNIFGAEFTGAGMLAVYPLDVLREDMEVHVVYDRAISYEGPPPLREIKYCIDCPSPISLKDVR